MRLMDFYPIVVTDRLFECRDFYGVKVTVARASAGMVSHLLLQSWTRKAPKRLVATR